MGDFWDCEFYKPLPRNLISLVPGEAKQAISNLQRPPMKGNNQMEHPNLRWLTVSGPDGRKSEVCFRSSSSSTQSTSDPDEQQSKPSRQLGVHAEMLEEEEDVENIFQVIEESSGQFRFSCSLHLPCALFGFIIGQRGSIKIGIENSTKTKINVPPKSDDIMGKIVIRGYARADVQAACRKIYHIVETNRSSIRPTHFISIPIDSANIKESFDKFRTVCPLDVSVLQTSEKLHFTLGMLILLNNEDVSAAASIIEDFVFEVLREKYPKLKLQVRGLEIMHDDPSMTRVLFGDVVKDEDHEEVQKFGKQLLSRLDNAGYLKKNKFSDTKLHMTVANAKFAEKNSNKNPSRGQEKEDCSFDATKVLQTFKDYNFGELIIDSLCICECGSATDEDGYTRVSQHFLDPKKANPSYICKN